MLATLETIDVIVIDASVARHPNIEWSLSIVWIDQRRGIKARS